MFLDFSGKTFNLDNHVTKFAEYDSWGQSEYNFCHRVRLKFQT